MMKRSKIIPIISFCFFLCNQIQAQTIFIQNFNDTAFYKKWKVSANIEHAKKSDINLSKFIRFHPKSLDEYIETPVIPIAKTHAYALIFDWNQSEIALQDSIQVLLSKNNGSSWKILKTLKNAQPQFWLRDSIYLGNFNANDSIILSWQYQAKEISLTQTFNVDNVQLKILDTVKDTQTIHAFEVKVTYLPAKAKVKIECKNLEGKNLQLRMYASKGVVLKNVALPTSKKNKIEIDVSDVSKGTYFIAVESNDEVYTEPILIQ